jgi:hypothetical protein
MLLAITQDLAHVQAKLSALRLGYFRSMHRHCEPGKFDAGAHRSCAMKLRLAEFEEWRAQQFLPTEAPNDPPAMPGAA